MATLQTEGMRRSCYKRDFHSNTAVLLELFALRASGIPLVTLARRYDRDRQTVRLQLQKYQIVPFTDVYNKKWGESKTPRPAPAWISYKKLAGVEQVVVEPINIGKNYKEYIEEGKKRGPSKYEVTPYYKIHDSMMKSSHFIKL